MLQKFETPSLTSICISASHFLCFFHLLSNLLYKSPNHPLSDLCFNCSTAVVCTLQCFTVGIKWIQYAKKLNKFRDKKKDGKKRMKFGKLSLLSFPAGKAPPRFSFSFIHTVVHSSPWSIRFSLFLILQCPHLFFRNTTCISLLRVIPPLMSSNEAKRTHHTSHETPKHTHAHTCTLDFSIMNTDLEVLGKIKYWIVASNMHVYSWRIL